MKIKNVILSSILLASSCHLLAGDKSIELNEIASYRDSAFIQSNIVSECTDLGRQFSASTKKYLEKSGWSVSFNSDTEELEEGAKLELQIVNAISSGNAFMGHLKSVSIEAKLYSGGKLVDSFKGVRNSNGGFGGGFKGSCSILARCVNTLGKDVSKWLKNVDLSG